MKNVVLILLLIPAIKNMNAQTLQFSQVKKVTTVDTVPAGKVWKLLSAPYKHDPVIQIGGYSQANPFIVAIQSILIDGNITYIHVSTLYDGSTWRAITNPTCQFPLWLPAGTTVAASTGVRFISVIEFTVVP